MNLQKYTQKSVAALQELQSIAEEFNNQQVEQGHMLLALLRQDGGLIPELIRRCGVDPPGVG